MKMSPGNALELVETVLTSGEYEARLNAAPLYTGDYCVRADLVESFPFSFTISIIWSYPKRSFYFFVATCWTFVKYQDLHKASSAHVFAGIVRQDFNSALKQLNWFLQERVPYLLSPSRLLPEGRA